MYPGITNYRENYVLPTAQANGEIHLGLGCRILTSNPSRDIRTITNATIQFFSVLTLLAINKFHQAIDDAGLSKRILVTSSIYDAIYGEIDNDPELIKWVNDTLPTIMKQPYLEGEIVHNLADLEIGLDWASFHTIPNNATLEQVTTILNSLE